MVVVFEIAISQLGGRFRGAIWVLDDDIDLMSPLAFHDLGVRHGGFAASAVRFFRRWSCAFPDGPPLVAQPVIESRVRQLWWPVQAETWTARDDVARNGPRPKAMLSDFVEMQAPLFDAAFFEWFMAEIGQQLGGMSLAVYPEPHGWGIDNVWCGAAATYAQHVLDRPRRANCAIIPLAVVHSDTRSFPRSSSAIAAGERAVHMTCLLAQAAASNFVAASLLRSNSTKSNVSWMSDPKALGYLGATGYDEADEHHRRARRRLLARASYKVGSRCAHVVAHGAPPTTSE